MTATNTITVIKLDHNGNEVWRYSGLLLERTPRRITIEAVFGRDDVDLGCVVFHRGDRLIEHFYSDRWYNVFELHDRDTGQLKGWYCNLARPAQITDDAIRQEDLALDLWVDPQGQVTLLDEDEFAALDLNRHEREAVHAAVEDLRQRARAGLLPFGANGPDR
ncbi:MAG: DUF402 domain-containing protein [Anaerolineae bacterium]